ncbi:hypothetical protein [Streptomyces sp. KR55]|uniref:hypothetical protein n=1 Tax=Streptomyces sp. KR55 TaxID=3457425 RepID=UPI003FD68668
MIIPIVENQKVTDMIEDGTEATILHTDAARAKLVMAYEACELADLARAFVPIGEHELRPDGTSCLPGTVLADAAQVIKLCTGSSRPRSCTSGWSVPTGRSPAMH